jgi:hypothetical protein
MPNARTSTDRDVFINCPFDSEYKQQFHALLFTVYDCGFSPRCAKEAPDSRSSSLPEDLSTHSGMSLPNTRSFPDRTRLVDSASSVQYDLGARHLVGGQSVTRSPGLGLGNARPRKIVSGPKASALRPLLLTVAAIAFGLQAQKCSLRICL